MLERNKKLSPRALRLLPALQQIDGIEVRDRGAFGFADGIEKPTFRFDAEDMIEPRGVYGLPTCRLKSLFRSVERREVQIPAICPAMYIVFLFIVFSPFSDFVLTQSGHPQPNYGRNEQTLMALWRKETCCHDNRERYRFHFAFPSTNDICAHFSTASSRVLQLPV